MFSSSPDPRLWVRCWLDLPGDEALRELPQVVAALRRQGDVAVLVEGLLLLARLQAQQGADDAACATLDEAQAALEAARDEALVGQMALARAGIDADCGRHARALSACHDVAEHARLRGDVFMVRQALFGHATSLGHLGEHDLAVETFEEALTLLRTQPGTLGEAERRVAAGRYTTGQAQAWLMRGGLLLEAGGREAASEAFGRARRLGEQACESLLGASPRFSHPALFGLVRVLLEAGEVGTARQWVRRVGAATQMVAPAGSLALAFWRLAGAMIDLRAGDEAPGQVLLRLKDVEGVRHPRVTGGDLRLSQLRCQFEAHEQAGQYQQALACQRQWAEVKGRLRTRLAREHVLWTEQRLASWRLEAGEVVASTLRAPLDQAAADLVQPSAEERLLEDSKTSLRRAGHSVRRAIDIADQYLSVMRAEHIRHEDLLSLDLATVVDDVVEQMAPPAHAAVRLEWAVERHVVIRGDRVLLMRAVGNLISNALKHAPDGSAVEVRLARAGPEVRLSVADQGPGLPLDMRARLFQRFATGAVRKGNGLGLAMVARAVRVHNGRVVVDSAPGCGTTVHLLLRSAEHGA